jgi:hypothetical protein
MIQKWGTAARDHVKPPLATTSPALRRGRREAPERACRQSTSPAPRSADAKQHEALCRFLDGGPVNRLAGGLERAQGLPRPCIVVSSRGYPIGIPPQPGSARMGAAALRRTLSPGSLGRGLSSARRAWRNVARRRGAMLVPRQGRRERPYPGIWTRLRTPPRGEQRGSTAQTAFRQALLVRRASSRRTEERFRTALDAYDEAF